MLLRLASIDDLPALVEFRRSAFVDELAIQSTDYKDVFNDHFSKNLIVVENDSGGERLLGALRLAFHRDKQRFYFSYLVIRAERRARYVGALLLGGALRVLEVNGVERVYADSRLALADLYQRFGCVQYSTPISKYGFHCQWLPMQFETRRSGGFHTWLADRAKKYLTTSECRWRFDVNLVVCRDEKEYADVLMQSMASRQIFAAPPVIAHGTRQTRRDVGALDASPMDGAFCEFNASLPDGNVIIAKRDSPARYAAACYSILTGKRLTLVERVDHFQPNDSMRSILLVGIPGDWDSRAVRHLLTLTRDATIGVVMWPDLAYGSRHILRSYLLFAVPDTDGERVYPSASVEGEAPKFDSMGSERFRATEGDPLRSTRRTLFEYGSTHQVLSPARLRDTNLARIRCRQLLCAGMSFGQTARKLNSEFVGKAEAHAFVVCGDSTLQICDHAPCQQR